MTLYLHFAGYSFIQPAVVMRENTKDKYREACLIMHHLWLYDFVLLFSLVMLQWDKLIITV